MKKSIIGLAGQARVGKDTAAALILQQTRGYRYSFAEPIRQMLKALGVDMSLPYWMENKEETIPWLGVSPRRLMQTLGTEWGREMISDRIWLQMAEHVLRQNGPGMVITDVRFDNEAEWVRENGGIVVHVRRGAAPKVEAHASEAGVRVVDGDFVVYNNGTIADLENELKEVLG